MTETQKFLLEWVIRHGDEEVDMSREEGYNNDSEYREKHHAARRYKFLEDTTPERRTFTYRITEEGKEYING